MGLVAFDRGPFRRVAAPVEPVQDHRTVVERGDDADNSSVIAGIPPVSPAATTGSRGGVCRHDRGLPGQQAVASVGRVERALGGEHAWPCVGQDFEEFADNLPMLGEIGRCELREPAKLAPSAATVSSSRAKLVARAAASPGSSGPRPPCRPHFRTSWVSSSRRRNSGIAGGTERPSPSAMPSTTDSSSEIKTADRPQPRQ